jgi:hypothetical protein
VKVSAFVRGVRNSKAFSVTVPDEDSYTLDRFKCAIHALAPVREYCGVKVIGHGVEADGSFYCCAHCAGMAGAEGVSDRARGIGAADGVHKPPLHPANRAYTRWALRMKRYG